MMKEKRREGRKIGGREKKVGERTSKLRTSNVQLNDQKERKESRFVISN